MSDGVADLKPVYLIHGTEELLLQRGLERLKDRFAAVADLDFNLETFDAGAAAVEDVVNAANTLPFMAERRLVVLRHVEKLNAEAQDALAEYAEDPARHTVLVLVGLKLAKGSRLYEAIERLDGVFEYKAPKRAEYGSAVVKLFAGIGKKIGTDAAEALVRAVGRDLRRLSVEADKVCAYVGDAGTVTLEDVERVMSETAPTSVFEFLDAFGGRDVRDALRLLGRLLEDGEAVHAVHAMAVRHVRNLIGARSVLDRGGGQSSVARELGMPEWLARRLIGQANRWTAGELAEALVAAGRVDGEMKTSRVQPRLALETWLAACAGPRRRGGRAR